MTRPTDLQRRRMMGALHAAGALQPWSSLSVAAAGKPGSNRLVLVILRGELDGLSAVPATGDTQFTAARGPLAQFASPALPLDNTFALHPSLAQLHTMYGRGELVVVHAVGLHYRERSHFDAQQVLESGSPRPFELGTGWRARALAASTMKSMALSTAVPLVLRGPGVVDTWAPSALPEPSADLVARIERLYEGDTALATALARARALRTGSAP